MPWNGLRSGSRPSWGATRRRGSVDGSPPPRVQRTLRTKRDPSSAHPDGGSAFTVCTKAFALEQNYPNPFNSGTVIRFALQQADDVELAVYNLAEQRVMNIAQGPRSAGSYTLRWDGCDDAGREVASGMYLYRLQAGEQLVTRKMLLLR